MKGDKTQNTQAILGTTENPYDSIKWPRSITELDKLIMAIIYNLPPLLSKDFLDTMELVAGLETVKASMTRLNKEGYIRYKRIGKDTYLTQGKALTRELNPHAKEIKEINIGLTFLDRYELKGYIFKSMLARLIRNQGYKKWKALSEQDRTAYIQKLYIENIVFKAFKAMGDKERNQHLQVLPLLNPEEKKKLQEAKVHEINPTLKPKYIQAVMKYWQKNGTPDEYKVFEANLLKAIETDAILTAKIWVRSFLSSDEVFGWVKEAVENGSLAPMENHNSYIYSRLLMLYEEDEKAMDIISQMVRYDNYLNVSRYNALCSSAIFSRGEIEEIEELSKMKEKTSQLLRDYKERSSIGYRTLYAKGTGNDICLTYQTLQANDIYISHVITNRQKAVRMVCYIVDGGYERPSTANYAKKLQITAELANLLNASVEYRVLSINQDRSRFIEGKLDTALKKTKMGEYDINTKAATTTGRHIFKFETPITRTKADMFKKLTSLDGNPDENELLNGD